MKCTQINKPRAKLLRYIKQIQPIVMKNNEIIGKMKEKKTVQESKA